ncbi:MAG: hypothetical protein MUF00_17295 [Gemmatimonadaceae bacterium]|jgi:hypothetical protein|nr:hypothetical protein [Gemmatimonadaceae bacterium]
MLSRLISLLPLFVTGCDMGVNCTLLPPPPTLQLSIRGNPPEPPYTITAMLPDRTPLGEIRCLPPRGCGQLLGFPGVTAPRMLIRIETTTAASETDVAPDYRIVFPNGPDCERGFSAVVPLVWP